VVTPWPGGSQGRCVLQRARCALPLGMVVWQVARPAVWSTPPAYLCAYSPYHSSGLWLTANVPYTDGDVVSSKAFCCDIITHNILSWCIRTGAPRNVDDDKRLVHAESVLPLLFLLLTVRRFCAPCASCHAAPFPTPSPRCVRSSTSGHTPVIPPLSSPVWTSFVPSTHLRQVGSRIWATTFSTASLILWSSVA